MDWFMLILHFSQETDAGAGCGPCDATDISRQLQGIWQFVLVELLMELNVDRISKQTVIMWQAFFSKFFFGNACRGINRISSDQNR